MDIKCNKAMYYKCINYKEYNKLKNNEVFTNFSRNKIDLLYSILINNGYDSILKDYWNYSINIIIRVRIEISNVRIHMVNDDYYLLQCSNSISEFKYYICDQIDGILGAIKMLENAV